MANLTNLRKCFINSLEDLHYQEDYLIPTIPTIIFKEKILSKIDIKKYWQKFLADKSQKNLPIDFYLHVPFCKKKCSYCICKSDIYSPEQVKSYTKNLIQQIDYFKDIFNEIKFNSLYIGGGTPSILDENQLHNILAALKSNYLFKANTQKTCEVNPALITLKKLEILKQIGINRISFGVQTLDKELLRVHNREYQTLKTVKNAMQMLEQIGFSETNMDIMIGLDGQTINNFKSTLKRILELNPSTVSIYPLKPRNEYLTKHFNSSSEKFYKHLHDLILPAENYIQGLVRIKKYKWPNPLKADRQATPSILLLHPYKYSSRYQFESNIKKSVFGLGPGANSYIFSKLEYRCISSNNRFHFKGFQKNTRLSMIQFILRSLSIYRSVKSELFVSSFQKELLNEFKEAITKLKETNLMEYENNELKFTTDDPKKQFYACLFFFEDKDVINSINREMVDNLIRFYINSNEYTFRIEIVNPKVSYYAKEGLFSLIHLEKNKLINQEDELVINEIGKMFTEICQNHINYSPSIILKNLSKEIIKKHPRLKSKFPQLSLKISVKG